MERQTTQQSYVRGERVGRYILGACQQELLGFFQGLQSQSAGNSGEAIDAALQVVK